MSSEEKAKMAEMMEAKRRYLAEMAAHKTRMMPFIRFLKRRGLKFKHANVKNMRVEYFRLDMFQELIEAHEEEIKADKKLSGLLETIEEDIIYLRRLKGSEKLKYPQKLEPTPEGKKGKFAAFKFDTTQSKRWMVIGLIIAIILVVMFPIWPYEVKYAAWLISFTFLMFLLFIIVLRLVIYVVVAIFGMSFWVFPNLFGDKGIIDSFLPFYSIQRWDNNIGSLIGRILAFVLFVYYAYSIYQNPELYIENIESTKKAMEDFHDWGVGKIKGQAGNFSQRALTVEKIINDTAEAFDNRTEAEI